MEKTVEQKLQALYELQTIHTQIDKIRQIRGELPVEVADLEDDVAGLETRIQKIKTDLDDLEDAIVTRKNTIKEAGVAIKKYEAQLNEVKNNREYEAISKEDKTKPKTEDHPSNGRRSLAGGNRLVFMFDHGIRILYMSVHTRPYVNA